MRTNQTRLLCAEDRPAIGLFLATASRIVAEAIGLGGFDWVLVDLQHGEANLDDARGMLQAISATPATPLVRVPWNEPALIQRTLDLGAYGVVVPMINSRADAMAAVGAAKYPPLGYRSWGPVRGTLYGGGDYFEQAGAETLLLAQIETAAAVERVDEIMAVEGIDGCYVGPNDLSISMGFPPESPSLAPPVEAAIERVAQAVHAATKIPGIMTYSAEVTNRRIRQGYRLIALGSDLRFLRNAAREELGRVQR